jgi:F-type H+-transporting ATPase subunit b
MLQIDLVSILLQIVNFVVLMYLLSRFLYKPLRAMLAARAKKVEGLMDNAAKLEAESYELKLRLEKQISEVDQERMIREAEEKARKQAEEILHTAQEKAEGLLARARREAELERLEALKANYERTLDTILDLSSGALRSVTVRQTHDNLVSSFAAYISQRPPEEVSEYRHALVGRETPLLVSTPVPLTGEQKRMLQDALSSLADRHIELQVQQDPSLIAGLRVRLGDRIVDNSLRQQLDLVRGQVSEELRERLGIAP